MIRIGTIIAAGLAYIWLSACATSAARPTADIGPAAEAIARAEAHDAATFAATELRAARTKLSKAKAARRMGDRARAQRLAVQAALDARLASALARAAGAERTVDEIRKSEDDVARAATTHLSRNP